LFVPPGLFFFYFLHNQSKRWDGLLSFKKREEVESDLVIHLFLVMLSMTEIQFQFLIFFFFLGLAQSIDRNQKKGTDISLSLSFVIGFELRDPPAASPLARGSTGDGTIPSIINGVGPGAASLNG
jgi:hypothetical protein